MNRMRIETSIGNIQLIEENERLIKISFEEDLPEDIPIKESDFLKVCQKELIEYFDGKRKTFDIPISLQGTKFQLLVWNALQKIPYGELCTYQDIAKMIGMPKAYRAVGMANHNNPIPIIVPCHRIVSKNGTLSGYIGGIDKKKKLISIEQNSE